MRFVAALFLGLLAAPALAQQPRPPMSPGEMAGVIEALLRQRDAANQGMLETAARLGAVTDELEKARKRITDLEARAKQPEPAK